MSEEMPVSGIPHGNGNGNGVLKPLGLSKPIGEASFAATALSTEGLRVAAQVRLKHLKNAQREDPDIEELHRHAKRMENFVDAKLKNYATNHPTYHWWGRITGFYLEIMGKILGSIEQFGKWYPVGDVMIPQQIKFPKPMKDLNGNSWVFVRGIERLTKASALRKFSGFTPDSKRVAGKLLDYNDELKTIVYRLVLFGCMLNKNRYYDQYVMYKDWKLKEINKNGIKIMPTPKSRFCSQCLEEKLVSKDTFTCPVCGTQLSPKKEMKGILFKGHLDAMCKRWLAQRILNDLWAIWRKAEGLVVTSPYPQSNLGHVDIVDPWSMCDKPEASLEREPARETDSVELITTV